MSNAEHTGQALREPCARKRQKLKSTGAEQGLIECRLKGVDAGGVMRARCCGGLAASVPPAKAIKSCAGFTPKRGGRGEVAD